LSQIDRIVTKYETQSWSSDVKVFGKLMFNEDRSIINDYGVGFVEVIAFIDPKRVGITVHTLDDSGAHAIRYVNEMALEKAERIFENLSNWVSSRNSFNFEEFVELEALHGLTIDIC
jgi:hypothetical protein